MKKLFEYWLLDAWYRPIHMISLYEHKSNLVALYSGDKSLLLTHRSEITSGKCSDLLNRLDLGGDKLVSVIDILERSQLIGLELEKPLVLDGFDQDIYLTDGKSEMYLRGSNMGCCLSEPEYYPNVIKVIGVINELKEAVGDYSVLKEFFELEPQS